MCYHHYTEVGGPSPHSHHKPFYPNDAYDISFEDDVSKLKREFISAKATINFIAQNTIVTAVKNEPVVRLKIEDRLSYFPEVTELRIPDKGYIDLRKRLLARKGLRSDYEEALAVIHKYEEILPNIDLLKCLGEI